MTYEYSEAFAQKMDQEDALFLPAEHLFPKIKGVERSISAEILFGLCSQNLSRIIWRRNLEIGLEWL